MPRRPTSASTGRFRLERVVAALPPGFEGLRAEAEAEGHRHLGRLAADWESRAMRFDRPGEILLALYSDGVLAGIGGLTEDPALPGALRMRRFYIGKRLRRSGLGRQLAATLIETAQKAERPVTVNAAAGSAPFWEALGFVADARAGRTHVLKQD